MSKKSGVPSKIADFKFLLSDILTWKILIQINKNFLIAFFRKLGLWKDANKTDTFSADNTVDEDNVVSFSYSYRYQ